MILFFHLEVFSKYFKTPKNVLFLNFSKSSKEKVLRNFLQKNLYLKKSTQTNFLNKIQNSEDS